jgi:CDP-6-deoxy-D-xylo-4-hexulose-3-dehydrase
VTENFANENAPTRISVGELRLGEEDRKAILEVIDSNRISEGNKTANFEREWAKFVGTKYCVAVNSGTSALITGLLSLKYLKEKPIGKCTKVITAPITYIATSNALVNSGFEPVYVDVDPDTFCITPENIRAHMETVRDPQEHSIILPVHVMGYMCDMDEINKIAKEYDLVTFEDAAQAHGSEYKDRKAGSLSLLSDFSFYIAHNIQAGELGTINTNDSEIARLARKIKANGRLCDCPICTRRTKGCPKIKSRSSEEDVDPRFTHDIIGFNFKTMEFQTAIASVQLKRIKEIIRKRQENVKYLNDGLERYSKIIKLPKYDKNVSYLAYPLVINDTKIASRQKLRARLEKKGIESRPLFGCIPTQQPAYKHLKSKYSGRLPVAENLGSNGFYIGCHQYLTNDELDYIIDVFGGLLR